jgi:hypothetical protein
VEGVDEAGHSQGQIQFLRQQPAQPSDAGSSSPQDIPPFVKILRRLRLGLDFRIETVVTRIAPTHGPLVLSIPLIPSEAVQTPGLTTKDGQILVSLDSEKEQVSWQSTLPVTDKIVLQAAETNSASEIWEVDASPQRHVDFSGLAPVRPKTTSGPWLPEWRPWPGEALTISIFRPSGVAGPTLTLDQTSLELHPGERATGAELALRLRSSQGTQYSLGFSRDTVLKSASIDGTPQTLRMLDGHVNLPVSPGVHRIRLALEWPAGVGFRIAAPAVDLGSPAVNLNVRMNLPENRWVLLTHGPKLGPAVLFWGELLIIIIAALGLARLGLVPLRAWQWFLLLVGLSQSPIWIGAAVVGWILAMGLRGRIVASHIGTLTFNALQILLGVYTMIFLWMVFSAVKQGLLGSPDMQISGNNSNAYFLNWYQDRGGPATPTVWVLSVPVMIYRALMLAWALWLAFALLSLLRFAYECYASNGLWKAMSRETLVKKTQEK